MSPETSINVDLFKVDCGHAPTMDNIDISGEFLLFKVYVLVRTGYSSKFVKIEVTNV